MTGRLKRFAIIAVVVSLCALMLTTSLSPRPSVTHEAVIARVMNPENFAFYGLTPAPDSQHSVPVVAPDGKTWYRGLDGDFGTVEIDLHSVRSVLDGQHDGRCLQMPVHRDFAETFHSWCQRRLGQHIGFVFHGRLVSTPVMLHELPATPQLLARGVPPELAEEVMRSLPEH